METVLVILLGLFAVGAALIGGLFLRGYLTGAPAASGIFGQRPERRLGVIEQSSLDGRRRLVLIRRDDVEHLIMTGGPVDVVIETNIAPSRRPAVAPPEPVTPVFTRAPRTLGQTAVNEH